MKINQGMNQVGASSVQVSPEVQKWVMASQVPKNLVEVLKDDLSPERQKAVFSSMDDLLKFIDDGMLDGANTGQKLIDLGFKKVDNIKERGEHYKLVSASGDYQHIKIIKIAGRPQVELNTKAGKEESQISYEVLSTQNSPKAVVINNLYVDNELARPGQKAELDLSRFVNK